MRKLPLAAAAFAAATSIWTTATPVLARDYPICIRGEGYGDGIGDCSFDTLQQCQAAASGRGDYCYANPFLAPTTNPSSVPSRRQKKLR
jgi:Protein of unknown function (DUF3551)